MKKLILAVAALVAISTGYTQETARFAKAERKEEKHQLRAERKFEVSDLTIRNFKSDFPNATNPSYARANAFDEVRFTENGVLSTAFYDWGSKLVGTTTRKQFSDLPASARKDILKQYKGYQVGEVLLFNDNEENDQDMVLYGMPFEDADNYFLTLIKDGKTSIVKVTPEGVVSFFKQL